MPVPDVLPEIDAHSASDIDLALRAEAIGYGRDGICHGENNLPALLRILGTFGPTTVEENLKSIRTKEQ
jgi:hypothetical protein